MTDPFAAAVTAAQAAQTAAAALQSQHAADTTALAADQATIAAQAAQIAQLEAELHPAPATVPGINATSVAQHATQTQVWGLPVQPWCWRYYLQVGEALHLPTEYALGAGETLVISGKIPPQNLTVAQLAAFYSTFPTDRDVYHCIWHEPEDDVQRGTFTTAQLRAGWHTARLAQQQVGNPHVKLVVILMGYTWQPASGRTPDDYIPADVDFDLLTTDTYFAGSIGQAVSTIPTAFDAQLATATAHGKPWGITETGVGQKVTGQARLDALTTLAKTIKAKGAVLGLYFDQGSSTDEWWLDPSGVAAWKAGLAA